MQNVGSDGARRPSGFPLPRPIPWDGALTYDILNPLTDPPCTIFNGGYAVSSVATWQGGNLQ